MCQELCPFLFYSSQSLPGGRGERDEEGLPQTEGHSQGHVEVEIRSQDWPSPGDSTTRRGASGSLPTLSSLCPPWWPEMTRSPIWTPGLL